MQHLKSFLIKHSGRILIPLFILLSPRISSSQLEWSVIPTPFEENDILNISFCNDHFIAIGKNILGYSTDGISWNLKDIEFGCLFGEVTYGNNTYIAACDKGEVWKSTDLSSFTRIYTNPDESFTHTVAVFGNNTFITSGYSFDTQSEELWSGWNISSTNGNTWTKSPLGNYNALLLDAVYRNNMFIAVGAVYGNKGLRGIAMTSPDGITWTDRTLETPDSVNELWAVAYGNNRFIGVGYNSESIISSDGINWSNITISKECSIKSISYGNGHFIAGGDSQLFSSTDGEKWETIPIAANFDFNGIAFGNDRFIINDRRKSLFVSDPIPVSTGKFPAFARRASVPVITFRNNTLRLQLPRSLHGMRPVLSCVDNLGRSLTLPFITSGNGITYADMSQLPAGAYILSINTGAILLKQRFIKAY